MATGDHILVQRLLPVPYTHHGIDCGDGAVIHYTGEPGQKADAQVKRTSMAEFMNGAGSVEVVYYRGGASLAPNEVVARAMSRLGATGYDLVSSNCEHFARWCKAGESSSRQIERIDPRNMSDPGWAPIPIIRYVRGRVAESLENRLRERFKRKKH